MSPECEREAAGSMNEHDARARSNERRHEPGQPEKRQDPFLIPPIAKRAAGCPVPLSYGQQRIWFLNECAPRNHFYNEPLFALRLAGPLRLSALERTIQEIVNRHEALRTTFAIHEGCPVQSIAEALTLRLPLIDLQRLDHGAAELEMQRLALHEARRCFDLRAGPLLRVAVLRFTLDEHVFFLMTHHIVSDGWSLHLLMREMAHLYEAFSRHAASPLSPLPIQYGDYAVWQREWLQGHVLDTLLAYWTRHLAKPWPPRQLPMDHRRPAEPSYRGARQVAMIDRELSHALKRLSRTHRVTLFMTLLAAFQILLNRYTGQDDMLIGTPVAGRLRPETEPIIGFFVNALVLRADLGGHPRFPELLERVRTVTLGAYEHQALPFEKLVEALQPEREVACHPLFQVLFGLHNYPIELPAFQSLKLERVEVDSGQAKFDLAMSISDLPAAGLRIQLDYSTDLFEAPTIDRMLARFKELLARIVERPDVHISAYHLDPVSLEDEDSYVCRIKAVFRKPVPL
jgi:hypothetical protein